MNLGVQTSPKILIIFPLDTYLGVGSLDHLVNPSSGRVEAVVSVLDGERMTQRSFHNGGG